MPSLDPQRRVLQARAAAAARHRLPAAAVLRRELALARAEDCLRAVLSTSPPLQEQDRQRLLAAVGLRASACPSCTDPTSVTRATS